jgi:coxsackievirus/adenovirus receptor
VCGSEEDEDPCDGICGGAGCGKCGGTSCHSAVDNASMALDWSQKSETILVEKDAAVAGLLDEVGLRVMRYYDISQS